ncbi:hypothetical protein [Kitasatospora humi]|nr:hypothetical protein [Kitasatospora humi]
MVFLLFLLSAQKVSVTLMLSVAVRVLALMSGFFTVTVVER